MTTTKLRKIGNSSGLLFSKEVMATAGFQEGQDVQIVAAPGTIAITAQPLLELNLTVEEAKAIEEGKWDSAEMQSVRQKISQKRKTQLA